MTSARTDVNFTGDGARIAIIGAGVSGLACARFLARAGMPVTVFEKSRGAGGRASTRRTDQGAIDHGCPLFRVRTDAAKAAFVELSCTSEWAGAWVGTPGMSAICRKLGGDVQLCFQTPIRSIQPEGERYRLVSDVPVDSIFDAVIVAVPAPQAATLLTPAPVLQQFARRVTYAPCWTVMVVFESPIDISQPIVQFQDSPLAWAYHDSTKPGRSTQNAWVLHSAPDWAKANLERDPESVARELLSAMEHSLKRSLPPTSLAIAHRWRYARAINPVHTVFLWDDASAIGCCGDWVAGDGIENALLSGAAMAEHLLSVQSRS